MVGEIERIQVRNFKAVGDIVYKWATGKLALPTDQDGNGDLSKFVEQLGVHATVPARIKRLIVIQPGIHDYILRLPPAALIDQTKNELRNGGSYPLPEFYFETDFANLESSSPAKKLELLDCRVADYTFAHCR